MRTRIPTAAACLATMSGRGPGGIDRSVARTVDGATPTFFATSRRVSPAANRAVRRSLPSASRSRRTSHPARSIRRSLVDMPAFWSRPVIAGLRGSCSAPSKQKRSIRCAGGQVRRPFGSIEQAAMYGRIPGFYFGPTEQVGLRRCDPAGPATARPASGATTRLGPATARPAATRDDPAGANDGSPGQDPRRASLPQVAP